MRSLLALMLILVPTLVHAQSAEERKQTLQYIASLRDPATGAFRVTPDGQPSLRACNGAVRAIRYFGGQLTESERVAAFILSCYDSKTGTFAEPGGKPDVAMTSVGVMAALEVSIPREKIRGAMTYLSENARTFEEVRIAAAAVEAWGVKDCPFSLDPWVAIARSELAKPVSDLQDGGARQLGSQYAFWLRLNKELPEKPQASARLRKGQRPDGGWAKPGAKDSDLESSYRVMRAFHLLQEKPDVPGMQNFIARCRNADGGYGTQPSTASSMSGVYYAAIITKWLKDAR